MDTFSSVEFSVSFVPGTLLLAVLLWFLKGFVGINLSLFDTGFGAAIAVLIAGYVLGHLVRVISNSVLGSRISEFRTRIVSELARDNDPHFSSEFRDRFAQKTRDLWGYLPAGNELFESCYSYLALHHAESNAVSKGRDVVLLRGLMGVAWVSAGLSLLIFAKHFILLLVHQAAVFLPVTAFFDYEESQLILGVILFIVFYWIKGVFRKRMESSNQAEISAVFRDFALLPRASGNN